MMMRNAIPKIALIGFPNCGKTSLFNALTGTHQKVANYPGITVERKTGLIISPGGCTMSILDLPGVYSLRGLSPDAAITRDVIAGRCEGESPPDALICVVDATNLRLALRLVLEVQSLGYPMMVALNMVDRAKNQGGYIDIDQLSRELGMPVIPIVAIHKTTISHLQHILDALILQKSDAPPHAWRNSSCSAVRMTYRDVERILIASSFRPSQHLWTRRLDMIFIHRFWGILILLAFLFIMFQAVFVGARPAMHAIESWVDMVDARICLIMPEGFLRSLLTQGIIAGVGSVLVFLPQILILFFFITLLEDSGYMARAAFLMDRLMTGVGLHGRAFIPLLSSFACAIPGVMSTRVIEDQKDRLTTMMIAPLMACSARLPIYTLIIAAFIPHRSIGLGVNLQGLVMFSVYALGIIMALAVSWVMKIIIWRQPAAPLLMEIPNYTWPTLRNMALNLWQRTTTFLYRAGTIILGLMIVIWFISTFPAAPENAIEPHMSYAIAGRLGYWLEPVMHPIGFNGQIAVALIAGMAAREVIVGTLAILYAISSTNVETVHNLHTILQESWSLPTALALLAWVMFAPQCAATLAVVKRETHSWKWPIIMFSYMMALAYAASFLTYHVTRWLIH